MPVHTMGPRSRAGIVSDTPRRVCWFADRRGPGRKATHDRPRIECGAGFRSMPFMAYTSAPAARHVVEPLLRCSSPSRSQMTGDGQHVQLLGRHRCVSVLRHLLAIPDLRHSCCECRRGFGTAVPPRPHRRGGVPTRTVSRGAISRAAPTTSRPEPTRSRRGPGTTPTAPASAVSGRTRSAPCRPSTAFPRSLLRRAAEAVDRGLWVGRWSWLAYRHVPYCSRFGCRPGSPVSSGSRGAGLTNHFHSAPAAAPDTYRAAVPSPAGSAGIRLTGPGSGWLRSTRVPRLS